MSAIKLYRHPLSGHCHRVELFLSILGLNTEIVDVDLANGAHKKDEFLSKNTFGQVPVLDDGDLTLSDSNAILTYLANKYDASAKWFPKDPIIATEVQRFLSVAAGELAGGPALARLVNVFGAKLDHQLVIAHAHSVLTTLDKHLAARDWLAASHPTIADLASYAYIAHAPEGDVSLESYSNIRAWLTRVEAIEGFIPMQATATGLAA
ncbi:MAG: glutathione S-transferase [Alteromonadaceae bacterium]|nr:MAG: glutathione S-transferase [Alteromonadaceae bacterium]